MIERRDPLLSTIESKIILLRAAKHHPYLATYLGIRLGLLLNINFPLLCQEQFLLQKSMFNTFLPGRTESCLSREFGRDLTLENES